MKFPTLSFKATSGLPSSGKFGHGVRLDLEGKHVITATQIAADQGMDWIAIDFDWGQQWPNSEVTPEWESLDKAMIQAQANHLSVMLSITNPPQWVLSSEGPDQTQTVKLLVTLTRRYPNTLRAIEILPAPNTYAGWGAKPNPSAYRDLLKAAHLTMRDEDTNVFIISGGLTPLLPKAHLEDMDDLAYLEKLYSAGAAQFMPIVGLQLPMHVGNPYTPPSELSYPVLRHYEEIRQVMLKSGHRDGLIWITNFSWPLSKDSYENISGDFTRDQNNWLIQSFSLFRKQLYLGAAFFKPLNPSMTDPEEAALSPTLVMPDKSLHPAFEEFGKWVPKETFERTLDSSTGKLKKINGKSYSKLLLTTR